MKYVSAVGEVKLPREYYFYHFVPLYLYSLFIYLSILLFPLKLIDRFAGWLLFLQTTMFTS